MSCWLIGLNLNPSRASIVHTRAQGMRNFLQKNSRSFTQLLWCFHISHECFDPVPATQIVGICFQKLCICTQLHIDQHFANFLSGQLLIQRVRQKASNLRWKGWDLGKPMRWICDLKNGVQSQRAMGLAFNCFSMHPFSNPTTWTVLHTKQMFWQGLARAQAGLAISCTKLPNKTFQLGLALSCPCLETRLGPAHSSASGRIGGGAGTISYSPRGRLSKAGVMSPGVTFCPMTTCANRNGPALFKAKKIASMKPYFASSPALFSCIVAKRLHGSRDCIFLPF